jgi:hypothetical protein
MTRKLTAHVYIDGSWYRPGEVPPSDVAERITNPKVWDGDAPTPEVGPISERTEVKQPWIEFAKSKGVEGDFDSKGALISELEKRGLIDKE